MENKTLNTIQVFAKIGRVLCKIMFILSIVGAASCAIGIASLAVGTTEVLKIGGVTIHGLIEKSAEMSMGTMYTSMTVGWVFCMGEIFVAKIAENYFKHEIEAGTPFTLNGAKEMLMLGLVSVCISVGSKIIAEIAYFIMSRSLSDVAEMNLGDYSSVSLGITFILVSFLCKYAAELQNDRHVD